jgi:hypothetical protein
MRTSRLLIALVVPGAILCVVLTALAWTLGTGSSVAQQGMMINCPPPGKWAITVWMGLTAETGQALSTCGASPVAAAYSLDPQTGAWSRWFAGRPEVSDLAALNSTQGILALGAAQAPATPTASIPLTPGLE